MTPSYRIEVTKRFPSPDLQGFKMPPDPRIYRGPRGETQRDFYGSFYVPPEKQYVEDLKTYKDPACWVETKKTRYRLWHYLITLNRRMIQCQHHL